MALARRCIHLFLCTVFLVKLWTGKSTSEAIKTVQHFFGNSQPYSLSTDNLFVQEAWENIKIIIGNKNFSDLESLSRSIQLLLSSYASGLPYIAFTVVCDDENTKARLESILTSLAVKYLTIHNMYPYVLTDWKVHGILHYPVLMIRYSENQEQSKIIESVMRLDNIAISGRHQSLTDENEGDISE